MASQCELEDEIADLESQVSTLKFDLETARVQRDNAQASLRQIAEVYQTVLEATESFEMQNVGANLAYLLGALAQGKTCEWSFGRKAARPWIGLLRELFPADHFIWAHVTLTDVEKIG